MNPVEECLEFALGKLEPLEREEAELKKQLDRVAAEKEPLAEIVERLKASKKKTKGGRKASKPSVKKEDVRAACLDLVKDNPGIEKAALEGLVEQKLVVDQGFGRNGLTMQIGKCLNSELFSIAADDTVVIAKTIGKAVGSTDTTSPSDTDLPVESSMRHEKFG